MKKTILLNLVLLLVTAASVPAETRLVPDEYGTIQDAIDACMDGDVVVAAPGIYTSLGNRDIDFRGKAIIVQSVEPNDQNTVAATIIDCDGTLEEPHRGFYFHSGEDANSVLDGFTITHGCAYGGSMLEGSSGGIYCKGSSPKIINCIISGNSAGYYGGGMSNCESSPMLINCIFSDNSANSGGGGIFNYDHSSPILMNCILKENSAIGSGGGMVNWYHSNPKIVNCTFNGNSTDLRDGGGMYNHESDPTLINCIFTGNSAYNCGGGIRNDGFHPPPTNNLFRDNWNSDENMTSNPGCDLILTNCTFFANSATHGNAMACNSYGGVRPSNVRLTNSILWNGGNEIWNKDNSTIIITYSDLQGGWPGLGNIDADPCFVDPGYWDANAIWVEGDYHLLGDSPCVDSGDPNYEAEPNETDLDGRPRVIGGRIDMGAYEFFHYIQAEVRITPRTINLASKSKWITCYICLPDDYSITDIDSNAIFLYGKIQAESVQVNEKQQVAIAEFSREEVQTILNTGEVELSIIGWLIDGTIFEGKDVIKVVQKSGAKPDRYVQASDPKPVDGETNVSITADLSWTAGPYATSHDVYFGTSSPPPFVCNQIDTAFDPGTMAYETKYYWRIDEVSKWGTTTGQVWNFTTTGSLPSPASNPNPTDGEQWVSPDADLSWTASSYATSHDVYFGTSSPPPFVCNQTSTTFDPGRMRTGTTYYWRIDEVNKWGKTTGQVWSFWVLLPFP